MTPPTSPCRRSLRQHLAPAAIALALWLSGCATTEPGDDNTDPPAVKAAAAAVAASAPADAVLAPLPDKAPAKAEDTAAVEAPVDPLRPEVRVDLDDRNAQEDLWERVRRGFAVADLDTDLVRRQEQWYASRPDYVKRMTDRGARYLFHIVEEVERRGLPTELALLPFIESAFNPTALSVAKASGIWQFMSATGRDYDLKQNLFQDDRRNVLASTRAALDHLQRLHRLFGDWHLVLAAYNWGEGNVQRAMARNERMGLPTDYLSLRMPDETRQYVPKLQAVKNIVLRPQAFSLELPPLANHPYFLGVPIARDMDVALVARLAGLSQDEFKALNPQLNKPVILAAGTPQVLLPYDNANDFVRNLQKHRGPLASWTAWVAAKTVRPADAARQLGVDEDTLREVNRIPPRMLIKAGSTLLVPRSEARPHDVPEQVAEQATINLAPDVPPLRHLRVKAGKKGDSVAAVAKRYKVSAEQLAEWNKVSTAARFKPGETISVFLPAGRATPQRLPKAERAEAPRKSAAKTTARPKAAAAAPRKAAASKR